MMESVEYLRTQLCEEERYLCEWHGEMWQNLMCEWQYGIEGKYGCKEKWMNFRVYRCVSESFLERMCESVVSWKSVWYK